MTNFLFSLLAFIVAMILLITVHEFGHFWVARILGVRVLRFSIGFGKPLLRHVGKSGTEYVLAVVPVGGYVKMLDEREGPVSQQELPFAFNRQSVLTRFAIVAAGPFFNLLFACFAYWLMFMVGTISIAPVIGKVQQGSIAAAAGMRPQQEIIAVGGKPTSNWQQVYLALMPYLGSKKSLPITVTDPHTSYTLQRNLDLSSWNDDNSQSRPVESLGITPYTPLIPPQVEEVTPNEAAGTAGMRAGDRVVKMNGTVIEDWLQFVDRVKSRPKQAIEVTVLRDGKQVALQLTPNARVDESGKTYGFAGVKVKPVKLPEKFLHRERYNVIQAIIPALQETAAMTMLSLTMLWKLVTGYVSLSSISGPVGIAKGAGISASLGAATYLNFLALISISLAVLNFLPIPVLDGGYLFYYVIEMLRGKPFSEKAETVALKVGLFLLISLMAVAFYNDVMRLVG